MMRSLKHRAAVGKEKPKATILAPTDPQKVPERLTSKQQQQKCIYLHLPAFLQ